MAETNGTIEQRRNACETLLQKYPNRVPIIVKGAFGSTPPTRKSKFLIPADMTAGMIVHEIRQNIPSLGKDEALFAFCGNTLLQTNRLAADVYERFKDPADGFLYITYSLENTFGSV